jgi:hypothetical protein
MGGGSKGGAEIGAESDEAGLGWRGRILLHGHCHQKALVGTDADVRLLTGLGFEVDLPDTGCCGLAGSFGYEARHYDLSMKIGERVLLPEVRGADPTTIVVTDGFSCRSQIAQGTDRRALHLAEVLSLIGRGEVGGEARSESRGELGAAGATRYPEWLIARSRARLGAVPVTIAAFSALALAGGVAWWARTRRRSGR